MCSRPWCSFSSWRPSWCGARNRWLKWPLSATIGILVFTFTQTVLGLEGSLAAHVTLGVALCAMETVLVLQSFLLRVEDPAPAAAA